jgi:hypothetical protein
MDPAFNSLALKSFLPIFNERSETCMNILKKRANGDVFDIRKVWIIFTLDTVLTTLMGLNENLQEAENHSYVKDIEMTVQINCQRGTNLFYIIDFFYKRTKLYALEQKFFHNGLFKLAEKIIRKKEERLSLDLSYQTAEKESEVCGDKPQIFIDTLFKNPGVFSPKQMKDEVSVMLIAVLAQMKTETLKS